MPYPTGHSEKSSIILFRETCFNMRSGIVVISPDSEGLGAAVEAQLGFEPHLAQWYYIDIMLSNNQILSVSCKLVNRSRSALVIWSTLQLTFKQWFITQQITAGADLFLKLKVG